MCSDRLLGEVDEVNVSRVECQATVEMSGLSDSRCRVCVSYRQQPFAPRMIPRGRDWVPNGADRAHSGRLHGPSGNDLIVERPTAVGAVPRSIQPRLHHDVGCANRGVHLVELPVVRHGPVTA